MVLARNSLRSNCSGRALRLRQLRTVPSPISRLRNIHPRSQAAEVCAAARGAPRTVKVGYAGSLGPTNLFPLDSFASSRTRSAIVGTPETSPGAGGDIFSRHDPFHSHPIGLAAQAVGDVSSGNQFELSGSHRVLVRHCLRQHVDRALSAIDDAHLYPKVLAIQPRKRARRTCSLHRQTAG